MNHNVKNSNTVDTNEKHSEAAWLPDVVGKSKFQDGSFVFQVVVPDNKVGSPLGDTVGAIAGSNVESDIDGTGVWGAGEVVVGKVVPGEAVPGVKGAGVMETGAGVTGAGVISGVGSGVGSRVGAGDGRGVSSGGSVTTSSPP